MGIRMRTWVLALLTLVQGSTLAFAGDFEWSGLYRVEGNLINNPELKTGTKHSKEYGTHHLILRPRIVAGDGLYISGQFHVLNNDGIGGPQLGSIFGDSLDEYNGIPGSSSADDSSAAGERVNESFIMASQFYLTLVQEYGSFIVGRAPVQFGLGATYSAGEGLFDHYYDSRDLVGYKVVMGNFYFFPMYAKLKEGSISGYDDISEILLQFQYENPESNVAMGVMYANRKASDSANNFPVDDGSQFGSDSPYGNGTVGGSIAGEMNLKTLNIFFAKRWDRHKVGFEIVNESGNYGVRNSDGDNIEASAFALAFEYDRVAPESRWNWGLKAGVASGDDPNTKKEYEGYSFDRNYDIAMLMFNHPLGQENLLRTQGLGTRYNSEFDGTLRNSAKDDPDIEGLSNVYYLAPHVTYKWRDRWNIEGVLAAGWLDQADFGGLSANKDLGYELDLSLVFTPNERIVWKNSLGVMLPGSAFEVDGTYDTSSAYGFVSRAAISF